jgi:hypothetical protein
MLLNQRNTKGNMDRPKPRVGASLATIIMGKFMGAKLAVKEALSQRRVENDKGPQNREARRYRAKTAWRFRKGWGMKSPGGSNVLRGYRGRYTHGYSEYFMAKRDHLTPNQRKAERRAAPARMRAANRRLASELGAAH